MVTTPYTLKYSIIVCYRNREEHLKIFVPLVKKHFGDRLHEIIIVEQNDNMRFQRGQLFNEGVNWAQGDVVIFHDVDHVPTENVEYWIPGTDVFLPIKQVEYVYNNLTSKPLEEVPSGYRHFKNSVDDDFFGGVIAFDKKVFKSINGFNSLYTGWGLEDADLRKRIQLSKLTVKRSTGGKFLALDHKDSNPGTDDAGYQQNHSLFNQSDKLLDYGVNSQQYLHTVRNVEKQEKYGIDVWVDASQLVYHSQRNTPSGRYKSIDSTTKMYSNTPEAHIDIWTGFKSLVNLTPELKEHRDWVVANNWGYGNRAFHWMWNLFIREARDNFKFLEIGVYKGQIISLISLLNKLYNKHGQIYGITPLSPASEKTGVPHPDINYEEAIQTIYAQFELTAEDLTILHGFSNEQAIMESAVINGAYDFVYIDGCHDYDVVLTDIEFYRQLIRIGGYLIVDDASCDLNIPDGLIRLDWRGLPDVTRAVQDTLYNDSSFEELFAVGHNRVWRRLK